VDITGFKKVFVPEIAMYAEDNVLTDEYKEQTYARMRELYFEVCNGDGVFVLDGDKSISIEQTDIAGPTPGVKVFIVKALCGVLDLTNGLKPKAPIQVPGCEIHEMRFPVDDPLGYGLFPTAPREDMLDAFEKDVNKAGKEIPMGRGSIVVDEVSTTYGVVTVKLTASVRNKAVVRA
jgi:hypothetical protein